MKRFLLKLAFLIGIIAFIMLFFSYIYENIRHRDNEYYSEEKFSTVPYNIQISNFGSSHGVFGFDYMDYSDKYTTFNFALISQSLSYDYLILQQYEDHFADNGIMFIVISNFSFGSDEEAQLDFQSKNERYYSFLESKYIKRYDWKNDLKLNYFRLFFSDPQTVIGDIRNANKKGQDTYQLGGVDFDYQKDADAAYQRHIRIDENGNMLINKKEIDALYGMINICKKHNITPVLLTTPYRSEYNNKFSDEFYKQFHDTINNVCEKTGVSYYDYSHDYRFVQSDKLERNADHLTPLGAVTFTDILINDLVEKKN